MLPSPAAGSTIKPRVLFATIYPPQPERSEVFVTRELLREYLSLKADFELSVLIASAHQTSLDQAKAMLDEFPEIPSQILYLETHHAGVRAEEISFCKEKISEAVANEKYDYLLFMDADVWTPILQVKTWIDEIENKLDTTYINIKYCLRGQLSAPAHTLGAYFHHKKLLDRLSYWKAIFPRDSEGRRLGAPDCNLYDFLAQNHCKEVVPKRLVSYHFNDLNTAQIYHDKRCFSLANARPTMRLVRSRLLSASRGLL